MAIYKLLYGRNIIFSLQKVYQHTKNRIIIPYYLLLKMKRFINKNNTISYKKYGKCATMIFT